MDSAYTVGEVVAPLLAGLPLSGFGVATVLAVRAALALASEFQTVQLFKSRGKEA